jgi:putative phage-type endonuclease
VAITPEQREARRTSIGSSDIAAILGIHPSLSAADVWATKMFDVEDHEHKPDWFEVGDALEPGIVQWVADQLGQGVEQSPETIRKDPIFHANLDGRLDDGNLVEAKTGNSEGWGEPGTDEVPAHVMAQVQWQMFLADAEITYVGAALASDYGIRLRMYEVRRDEKIITALRQRAVDWWETHITQHQRPGDTPPKLELLKRVRRETGSRVHVDEMLIEAYVQADRDQKKANAAVKRAKAALIEAMEEGESTMSDKYEVTYLSQSRKESVIKASTFRVLRYKRKKEVVE